MAAVSFLYPPEPVNGTSFDLDYFLVHHVDKILSVYEGTTFSGLEIFEYEPGQPFQILGVSRFGSLDDFRAIDLQPLLDDLPKFTNTIPYILLGESVETRDPLPSKNSKRFEPRK